MSSVQRGDRRRPFGFRMQANNFVIWQMKAGQVLEKASRLKFKDTTGFPLHRATGWIGNSDKSEGFYFREWFCTICVYTRRKAGTATGLVLSWIDDKPHYLSHAEDWRNKYIEDCGYDGATYTFFIRKVFWACTLWHELWIKTLDEIDLLINVQMLRIFSDWIREVEESLPGLYNEVKEAAFFLQESCRNDELDNTFEFNLNTDILSQNLEKLDSKMRSSIRGLEARIERKKVEVESLRDGLFNAASLREAVNARTLNLFVIVFTVVTVIYTPLGFLATLWSMSNLSNDLEGTASTTTPQSFISSWIILPLGTYLSSVIFLFIAWVKTSPSGGIFWQRTLARGWYPYDYAYDKFEDVRDWLKRACRPRERNTARDEEHANPRID